MRNDYNEGDKIRQIYDGKSGVFIRYDRNPDFCWIQMNESKGESMQPVDNIADADHPIIEQVKNWKAEGKSRGYDTIFIAKDEANKKFRAFYGHGTTSRDPLVKKHPELHFIFMWPIF